MDDLTKQALEESIEHWEKNTTCDIDDASVGAGNCALCLIFFYDENKRYLPEQKLCKGCPVYEKTGEKFCKGTPYLEARAVLSRVHFSDKPATKKTIAKFREKAKAMFEWLKELREP